MSSRRKRSRLKSSTLNDASTEPRIIAVRIDCGEVFPVRASQPMKPPANESPAPVGSTTFSIGNAGAAKTPPSWNSSAPASPRLMTTARGPIARIARAAAGRLD